MPRHARQHLLERGFHIGYRGSAADFEPKAKERQVDLRRAENGGKRVLARQLGGKPAQHIPLRTELHAYPVLVCFEMV